MWVGVGVGVSTGMGMGVRVGMGYKSILQLCKGEEEQVRWWERRASLVTCNSQHALPHHRMETWVAAGAA